MPLPTYDLCVIIEHKRGSGIRWMDVLGFRKHVHLEDPSPCLCLLCGCQEPVRPIWQASDYPVTALQGWNMFLISVKLPAANSIMWLFSRCLSYSFFVSLRNTLRIPLFFLSPYTVKKFSCWRRTKHPCWRKKVNFPSNRQFGSAPSALDDEFLMESTTFYSVS